MKEWFIHWIIQDLYTPVWPNVVASGLVGTMLWLKLHAIHKHVKRKGQ